MIDSHADGEDEPMEHVVPAELDGERLDVALASVHGVSRSAAARLITDGLATVGDEHRARSYRVSAGEAIVVTTAERIETPPPPVPPIRYEDEHLLVIAKPAGLVVHPGAGNPDGTLVDALRAAGVRLAGRAGEQRPGIVHRLDKETSGLLVVAKTDEVHAALVAALKRRAVRRDYLALVAGTLPAASGRVEAPIGRHPTRRTQFAVVADGKPSVTHWHRLGEGVLAEHPVQLIRCRLETGRTHQIRVHLAYAGCAVVGDATYGGAPALAAAAGLDRFFLHAFALTFDHPVTGAAVKVSEPLPSDLYEALVRAGLDPALVPADAG